MSKRVNNEGSVYQRKDGRWVGQITIDGRRKYKYSKTKTAAREWLKEMEKQIDQGLTHDALSITVKEYLEEWMQVKEMELKPKTAHQCRQLINNHVLPYLGKYKLGEVKPALIQTTYSKLRKSNASDRTIGFIHAVLHHAFSMAVKQGTIGRNPTDAVTKPKYRSPEMSTWDNNQALIFLSHAEQTRLAVFFYLALDTGMRMGELIGLQWKDVNWENQTLSIRRQIQRLPGQGLVEVEPKSKTSKRMIKVGKNTIQKLYAQEATVMQLKEFAGENWSEHDLVFPNTVGSPLEQGNIRRTYQKLIKEANLPYIKFHELRHTSATLMLQAGTNLKIVQNRLGHSQISLTLDTYSHVLPNMQDEVAEKMDELLNPATIEVKQK